MTVLLSLMLSTTECQQSNEGGIILCINIVHEMSLILQLLDDMAMVINTSS